MILRHLSGLQDNYDKLRKRRESIEIELKAVKEKVFLTDCLQLLKQRREWQYYFHLKRGLNLINDSIQIQQPAYERIPNLLKSALADITRSSVNLSNAEAAAEETNTKVFS